MGVVSRAVRAITKEDFAKGKDWDDLIGVSTQAGIPVNEKSALRWGPYFDGVRIISEDVGSLPLHLYRRLDPRGKKRAQDHHLYELLHERPNPVMGAMALRETLQGHALTWGNGYAYIARSSGRVTGLWPLRPDRMTVEVERNNAGDSRVVYVYEDHVNNIHARLLADEVLHLAGFGFDGLRGYSPVKLARDTIGLGRATEQYGASFFGNGSQPGGVLQHPDNLSPDAQRRLKSDWEEKHRGIDQAQRVAILEEGMEWKQVGIPPGDAQFLETRKFQVTEASRWLRIPPHKLGDLERATFSNIEEQSLDYVISTLRPWLVRWEQAIANRVLDAGMRDDGLFAEHLIEGLLRGDIQSRYDAYSTARQDGWMNADDIRALENMNPLPDGKGQVYLVPLNMQPLSAVSGGGQPRVGLPGRGRGVQARRRLSEVFYPKLEQADRTLAGMERNRVSALVDEHLARSRQPGEFDAQLERLYEDEILPAWRTNVGAVVATLAGEAAADAASDIAADPPDLADFVASYNASHAAFRVGSSKGQIRHLLREADDPAEAITARLDDWVDKRPGKTAQWESIQVPNASARETWQRSGVQRIRWQASGKNCPYCSTMDGKTVGMQEAFLESGTEFQPSGADKPLTAATNVYHPPAHPGCDCSVSPS